jgi:putative membrane protein
MEQRRCIVLVKCKLINLGGIAPVNRSRICKFFVHGSCALILCSGLANAQMGQPTPSPSGIPGSRDPTANNPTMPGPTANNPMADRDFVKEALQGGMAEVQMGQLALQKSSNEDIKQFAQRMVTDHTKMGDQMKPIALQLGVKEPTDLSKKDKSTIAKLQNLDGDAFDKAYVQTMLKDHKHDQAAFRQAADKAADPNVKQAATQGEAVISDHLQHIQQIAKSEGLTEKGGDKSNK